ncbi:DUF924 family protein [Endozoicomonas ascidiicola]|uniref:DUF924 family protein n=1 Tax=Endozoicomonas ascidiicola TaxID=1698521 RepID=UPI000833547A|nr:DUF924 family protein [Endozoicomonas ascidiicola]
MGLLFKDVKHPSFTYFFLAACLTAAAVFGAEWHLEQHSPTNENTQTWLSQTHPDALKVLRFWFEEWELDIQRGGVGRYNEKWFPHGPEGTSGSKVVDQASRENFLGLYDQVVAGQHQWNVSENPFDNLAYIILTDQLSRNMFRGSERAYAHDALGRVAAEINLEKKLYKHYFTGYQQLFVVFPMMHHEHLDSQVKSIEYLKALNENASTPYAFLKAMEKGFQHYQMIYMFGRFPHRNEVLNRESTPLEKSYIQKEGEKGFINGAKW